MRAYTLTHLEDHELVSNLKSLLETGAVVLDDPYPVPTARSA